MNRTLLMSGLCAGAIIAATSVGVTAMMTSDNSSNAAVMTSTSATTTSPATTSTSMTPSMSTSMTNDMSGDQKMGNGDVVRQVSLNTMPTGWVSFGPDSSGHLQVTVQVEGLTPGSAHTVEIDAGANPVPVTVLDTLTANSLGQAEATLSSMDTNALPAGADVAIRLGLHGGDNNQNPLAGEVIARTDPLPRDPAGHRSGRRQSREMTM